VRRTYGEEALSLVDRALVVQPTSALYGLRVRAAISAARPEVLVESIASYARSLSAAASQRTGTRRTLEQMAKLLDEAAQQSPENAPRARAVQAAVRVSIDAL
jgi:hypothetical protein